MILSHPIHKQVHTVVRLSIVAGKMFFVASLRKPLPNKILNHYTNTIISMEYTLHKFLSTIAPNYNKHQRRIQHFKEVSQTD